MWLTGLPAAGKTSIANACVAQLEARGVLATVLDGDVLRRGLCADLGFSEADRHENIRRAAAVAALFADAGMIVLAAFVSPLRSMREAARRTIGAARFLEVHVDCPLVECERRDPKGLYARARRGELPDLTGLGAPYERPQAPALVLETADSSVDACADRVVRLLAATGHG